MKNNKVLLINISDYHEEMNAKELYDKTRGFWKISSSAADEHNFVMAVYKGVIREVYEVSQWFLSDPNISGMDEECYEFVGKVASPTVRGKYVNREVGSVIYGAKKDGSF